MTHIYYTYDERGEGVNTNIGRISGSHILKKKLTDKLRNQNDAHNNLEEFAFN